MFFSRLTKGLLEALENATLQRLSLLNIIIQVQANKEIQLKTNDQAVQAKSENPFGQHHWHIKPTRINYKKVLLHSRI
jgi:hypothetical protein